MPQNPETTERGRMVFNLEKGNNDTQVSFQSIRKNELNNLAEEHGFPSRAAFLRAMVELGLYHFTRDDPMEREQEEYNDDDATTIRELVPEGKENAVDVRDDLPEIIDEDLLNIVDNDPKIEREGWKVYR